jgi:L-ascorbate metabolism protein UlaG (beta-lactamase superfamily)
MIRRSVLTLSVTAVLAGCFGAPRYDGPRTAHFDGDAFHNDPRVPQPGAGDVLRWMVSTPNEAIGWAEAPPVVPAAPPARVDSGIRVTFVNHATVLVQMDGVAVLTDPVWSERVGPVSFAGPSRAAEPGVRFEDLPVIDAVLISHSHYDHCDVPTLEALEARFGMPIFAGLGSAGMLAEHGVATGKDLDWWQSAAIGEGRVTMTPARHGSQRGLGDRDAVLWGGFVLEGRSGSVFFAGDTAFAPHFAEIRRRLGAPTVALLPIGAYEPRWFMQNIHMSPADAVRAHVVLGARQSIGIHWGTFDLSDEGRFQPAGDLTMALRGAGVAERRFLAARNGQSFVVERAPAR